MKLIRPLLKNRACLQAILASAVLLFSVQMAGAQDTWNGGTSSWTTATNWSTGSVPGSADTVAIGTTGTYPNFTYAAGTTNTIAALNLSGAGTLFSSTSANNTLAVTGALTASGTTNVVRDSGSGVLNLNLGSISVTGTTLNFGQAAATNNNIGNITVGSGGITLSGSSGLNFGLATSSTNNGTTGNISIGGTTSIAKGTLGINPGSSSTVSFGAVTFTDTGELSLNTGPTTVASTTTVNVGILSSSVIGHVAVQFNSTNATGGTISSILNLGDNTANTYSYAGRLADNTGSGTGYQLSLNKTGTDTQVLSGASSYSGGTTISGGVLESANATGMGSSTSALAINSGGTLDIGNIAQTVGATTLGLTSSSAGSTIQNVLGSGTIATKVLTTSGVTVNGTNNTIASNVSVTGAVTQSANSGLTVNGTIGADTLNSAATLNGLGTVGALTVNSGSTITPGTGGTSDVLTSSGTLTFNGGGTLAFNLSSSNNNSSLLNLGSNALTKGLAGVYNISLSGGLTTAGTTYDLINFGSTTFSSSDFTESGSLTGNFQIMNGNELAFVVAAVPEPSTWTMLLAGSILLFFWQRHSRKSRLL